MISVILLLPNNFFAQSENHKSNFEEGENHFTITILHCLLELPLYLKEMTLTLLLGLQII